MLITYFFCFTFLSVSVALQIIDLNNSLRDGDTLVSAGRKFELGYFSPTGSTLRYLGLWYANINPQTIVWVANRELPLSNTMGILNISSQGILVLVNSTNSVIWSSNASRTVQDPVAELLDSGNLVVRDRNDNDQPENFLWQSFDHPSDTLLPGMKGGKNLVTGLEVYLSSWKSIGDPAPGEFTTSMDLNGCPQLVVKEGASILYRAGSWDGIGFTGTRRMKPDPTAAFDFVINENEVYFTFELLNNSSPMRYTLNPSGLVQRFIWSDISKDWLPVATSQADQCDNYRLCGAYGSCHIYSSSTCECLNGFTPNSSQQWESRDWSGGCVRTTPLKCDNKDAFLKVSGIKLPDTSSSWYNKSIGLKECQELCKKNCSCTGYANMDVNDGGSGCLLWFDGLIDIRTLNENGQDLYVKLAASEVDKIEGNGPFVRSKKGEVIVSCALLTAVLTVATIVYLWRKNRGKANCECSKEDMEMPIFDLTTLVNATNNFSSSNKIGEGGFGPVYKGTLIGGQEVAVKRLSKSSGQGMNELKNEVMLIAKLQHRNLVKLLGCCTHKDEKMLIYEYMPNRSLDLYIFDQTRSKLLDWHKRFHIIGGIARGLLYLHQDSRLRIIHRDLKASNVLLDSQMNPKISDFGLARTFGGDQTEANTNRVVGTYGYMSPEYALHGHFSVKSDIFSLGVLIIEIVSGKKNRGFYQPDHSQNLLSHAWMLWSEENPSQLIDDNLNGVYDPNEVLRCIQVALLCVQQRPEDRPNMTSVVGMLGGENPLPQPKQPGFYLGKNSCGEETSSKKTEYYSSNEVTITQLEAR